MLMVDDKIFLPFVEAAGCLSRLGLHTHPPKGDKELHVCWILNQVREKTLQRQGSVLYH